MAFDWNPVEHIGSGSQGQTQRYLAYGVLAAYVVLGGTLVWTLSKTDQFFGEHWPATLNTGAFQYKERPTNTTGALAQNWKPMDAPCVESLGQPWVYNGVLDEKSPVTLYFTPAVRDMPGRLSGIEVHYFGYIEENLVGKFFSEERTAENGSTYHSVAVGLRNPKKQNLCDVNKPINVVHSQYIAIAPDLVNMVVPITNTTKDLTENWSEGSCIFGMGIHWGRDVLTGSDMSWKAENLVPVVPMYSSTDGTISALFFVASSRKQTWSMELCGPDPRNPINASACIAGLNMWDSSPGLPQSNEIPGRFCNNFCGEDCEFTGSPDDMYTTMHWHFKEKEVMQAEKCFGHEKPFCASGEYPQPYPAP